MTKEQILGRETPQWGVANPQAGRHNGVMDAPSFSASWIQQDRAYLAHHFQCPACIAGGQGRGKRCETGAGLWAAYTKASMQGAR